MDGVLDVRGKCDGRINSEMEAGRSVGIGEIGEEYCSI